MTYNCNTCNTGKLIVRGDIAVTGLYNKVWCINSNNPIFSSFISLIGEISELREKDYGDRQRGAQRLVPKILYFTK